MEKYFVINDLNFLTDSKGTHYIISDEVGVYLKVSEELFEFLKKIINIINYEKMNNQQYLKGNIKVDSYEKGIKFLKKYNLIYEEGKAPIKKSTLETEVLGHKIKEFKFEKYRKSKILALSLVMILLINIPIGIKNIENCIYTNIIKDFISEYNKFNMISGISIISIILVVILSVLLHETFHILFANLYEVSVRNISFYLLLGIQPVVFVKYRDLIVLEKFEKILVYLGGFIANLMMINFSFFLISIYNHWVFGIFIVVNIFLILDNLSIINNTDFYYVLTEILNTTTFKVKILRKLGALLNKEITIREFIFKRENILGNLYLCIGTGFRAFSVYLFIYFIISSLTSIKYVETIAIILVITYLILSMRKFINNIKMAAI